MRPTRRSTTTPSCATRELRGHCASSSSPTLLCRRWPTSLGVCSRPMTADCQLCARDHREPPEQCPQSRSGQTLGGKYKLGALLGVGAISAVYAAEHAVLRRETAVKVLHRRFA